MSGVGMVTDSTSSLDRAAAARAGITVIDLQVVIDGDSRPESEVPASEVAAALRAGRRVSTSRPSSQALAQAYAQLAEAGFDSAVSVHLSGRISGTVAAAQVAADDAPLPVTVVDSRSLAMAVGFAALSGAEAAREGAPAAEVAEIVRRRSAGSTTFFCVDSLEYLRRGGRIGNAAALLGSALAVKPLLTIADGEIRAYERVRTESKALLRLEELSLAALTRASGRGRPVDVAVHHLDNRDGADRLVARLATRGTCSEIVVAEVSAVLGVHVGPGTLGIVVSPH